MPNLETAARALDTSGTVHGVPGAPAGQGTYHPVDLDWCDLTPFAQGYIEALMGDFVAGLLTQTVGFDHPHIVAFGEKVRALAFHDLAPETLARIISDCAEMTDDEGDYTSGDREGGAEYWQDRQATLHPERLPPGSFWTPLTIQLGADGLIRFAA